MLISNDYKNLNSTKHLLNHTWGTNAGKKWSWKVEELAKKYGTTDILDYGCGKASLNESLPFFIHSYDPNVLKYSDLPDKHDIVVSFDVLEHVEPECIEDVLDHIAHLTKKAAFLNIATRPAKHTLPDGTNAHRIIESPTWWRNHIQTRFTIISENIIYGDKARVDFLVEALKE